MSHFMRLLEPAVTDTLARHEAPVFVDAAAGKGYLGLLLAALPLRAAGRGRVVGIERRDDLVGTVERVATDLTLPFEAVHASTLDAPLPERIHGVFALHACDLATDEAIVRGILAGADTIAVVPCCQAELARLLGDAPRDTAISPLWRGAWHRREFGAHATNVIRALTLEAYGYQVTVTELAGWEHSLKNELILGRRVGRYHLGAWRQRQELLEALGVSPWLVGALDAATPPELRAAHD
ncbi:MAG: methyltransferase [Myxococcales bacterium]|nr:methyltransferase [Myxococcales bacterium]MCB9533244.1 methyltransferase [Myxococcales bacterium]